MHSPLALKHHGKKIAIHSPVGWRTPPRQYGARETVASNLVEGLVRNGWDVPLYATADSVTRGRLSAVVPCGTEEKKNRLDPRLAEAMHLAHCFDRADHFDLLHSHCDFSALPYAALVPTPALFTLHGFHSTDELNFYRQYNGQVSYVSISDADRDPGLDYAATVYDGIDLSLHTMAEVGGEDLVFLGRLDPEKSPHLAIEVARRANRRLLIAGIITDGPYFNRMCMPFVDGKRVVYLGPVDAAARNDLFARAAAVLQLNEVPERFGLVLAEANACGVPVIAMDRGSCREVIAHGETGFLVNSVEEALAALKRLPEIDRTACRRRVEEHFSMAAMVSRYEEVYDRILSGVS